MGMPTLNINFKTAASTAVKRGARGTLLLILKGAVPSGNPLTITGLADVPSSVSSANKEYIELALKGHDHAPLKVIAYFISSSDGEVSTALTWAATQKIDWVVMPTAETDGTVDAIKQWVIEQKNYQNEVRAVLPNCAANSEYIVNCTGDIITKTKTYDAEALCARVAGMICGTDLEHSITYATIPEAVDCTRKTTTELGKAIDAGELVTFFDGEKVKIARGVNSLTTTSDIRGSEYKKIKNIEAMCLIKSDLRRLCQDSYVGRYANTYSNRCLLLAAVEDYFDTLIEDGAISTREVAFDIKGIKSAMSKAGISYSSMTEQEIKEYDFGSGVYISVKTKLLDAIEDISIEIETSGGDE